MLHLWGPETCAGPHSPLLRVIGAQNKAHWAELPHGRAQTFRFTARQITFALVCGVATGAHLALLNMAETYSSLCVKLW